MAWSSRVAGISDARKGASNPSFSISAPLVKATGITEMMSTGPNVGVLARCDQKWTQGLIGEATSGAPRRRQGIHHADEASGSATLWRCPLKDFG